MKHIEIIAQIERYHNLAMDLAEKALIAKSRKNIKESRLLFLKAFANESTAARLISSTDLEPSRSVLQRSAATLALDCEKYREAENFVNIGLAGNPPEEIIEELKEVSKQINFSKQAIGEAPKENISLVEKIGDIAYAIGLPVPIKS
jgi:hypothetical protein